jgi:hypothetical protein
MKINPALIVAAGLIAAGPAAGRASAALAPVDLAFPDGTRQDAWVEVASAVAIRYKDKPEAGASKDLLISQLASLFFYEPSDFSEAMALFKGRKYTEAVVKFEACAAAYKETHGAPGNYSSLARYYAMECQRKLGNLDQLAKMRDGFDKTRLAREADRVQFDLYQLWETLAKPTWDRLDDEAKQWLERKDLSGPQRAQAAYCLGMACENLGRIEEAAIAYGTAMTASGGEEETVIREAALASMRTYLNDPLVKTAMSVFGTAREAPASAGHLRLLEACGLAEAFPKRLSAGRPLPPEFAELLKFKTNSKPSGPAK